MAQKRVLRPINAKRGQTARAYALPPGEYWIKSETDSPLGVRLEVSDGPHGLLVRVSPFVGTPDLTTVNDGDRSVAAVQYRQDPRAQAFKRWYQGTATDSDRALLGPEYRTDERREQFEAARARGGSETV